MNRIKPILVAIYVLYLRAVRAFWSWRVRVWAHDIKKATACIKRHPTSFPQQGENLAYYRGKVEAARARALRAGAELELIARWQSMPKTRYGFCPVCAKRTTIGINGKIQYHKPLNGYGRCVGSALSAACSDSEEVRP